MAEGGLSHAQEGSVGEDVHVDNHGNTLDNNVVVGTFAHSHEGMILGEEINIPTLPSLAAADEFDPLRNGLDPNVDVDKIFKRICMPGQWWKDKDLLSKSIQLVTTQHGWKPRNNGNKISCSREGNNDYVRNYGGNKGADCAIV